MTLTKEQIELRYMRVPAAGLALGITSDAVYRLMQTGKLSGICEGSRWYVERKSVDRFKASRSVEPDPAGSAA